MNEKKFDFRLHDYVDGSLDLDRTIVWFVVGGRDHFSRQYLRRAIAAWQNLPIQKNTAIMLSVDGYENDPRELWEIPEVCEYIQKFCARTNAHKHPALDPASRNLLLLCGADPTRKYTLEPVSEEQSINDSMEFFKKQLKE